MLCVALQCTAGVASFVRARSFDVDSTLNQTVQTAQFVANFYDVLSLPTFGSLYQYAGAVAVSAGPVTGGGGQPISSVDMSLATLITATSVGAGPVAVTNAGAWLVYIPGAPPTDNSGRVIVYTGK